MSQVTRAASKLKFETGDRPTQQDFTDLHDSVTWYDDSLSGRITVPILDLDDIDIYQLLGSTICSEPLGLSAANISNITAMVDGTLYIICMRHKKQATITGIHFYQGTQGNYTADNENRLGLYTYSAGVLSLAYSCANDGNLWKQTANTWNKKAFSSQFPNAPAGVYFAGLLYNSSAQVAAPATAQTTSMLSSGNGLLLDFTNSVKVHATLAGQAILPTSVNMSALTIAPTQRIYVNFYT